MSFLQLICGGRAYEAKVMAYDSTIDGEFVSAQTKIGKQHFPFKTEHTDINFSLIMRNHAELQWFAEFVRRHHMIALGNDAQTMRLNWPERGIDNWSGFVKSIQTGEQMGITAPRVVISFILIDSLTSRRTWTASSGGDFSEIYDGYDGSLPFLSPGSKQTYDGNKIYTNRVHEGFVLPAAATNLPGTSNLPNGTRRN